ncbi:unnamed protein product [Hymenolepis diminuta]|uniref:WD_REPEATS_REGION domain-containing protein n=1 Tax=Hymenolepis diminuta TaxID=6216 RepID=A0A0R3SWG7_HYMDI|nr:unnamed protein product [Hymenolepis diminuta]
MANKLYPAVPFVERGKHIIIGAHPKGGFIVYPNKKNVFIRDLTSKMDNDMYSGHSFEVQSAKYSPSGFYIASGDKSGKLHIWDTTQKEHPLKNEFPVLASINDVCWSSDNQRIAVGGNSGEKFGKVINAEMGTEVGEVIGMSKPINCVDMKPTRPYRLATGSEDFTATFLEGPPFKFSKSLRDHTNFVQCCKFSPKGDVLVTGGSDGKLFAYDATSGEKIAEIGSPAHKGGIYGIDFSPSGQRLVSVSADKKIKLWNTDQPFEMLFEYAFEDKLANMQLGCVWTVGKIVSLGLDGSMTCFDVADDASKLEVPSNVFFGHSRPIQRSCYSTSAEQLITTSYDGLMVRWNLSTGLAEPFEGKEGHTSAINGVVTCGDRVASVGVDDRIVFSLLSKKTYEQSMKLASQPRGLCIASSKSLIVAICMKHLYVFSLASDAPTTPLTMLEIPLEASTGCISQDGEMLAIGKTDGNVEFYLLADGGKSLVSVSESVKMEAECTTLAFSPDTSYLIVGDSNRYLRLFEVEGVSDGKPKFSRTREWRDHAARVTCTAWTPDGKHLATGGLDCAIMIFSPTTTSKICEVRNAHPANMITSLIWKSNTELISTGQDACVRTWKLN